LSGNQYSPIDEWNTLRGISQSTAFVGVTPGGGLTFMDDERRRRRTPVGGASDEWARMADGAGGGEWAPSSDMMDAVSISTWATMVGRVATPGGGGERGIARGERGTERRRRDASTSSSDALALLSRRREPVVVSSCALPFA